MIFGLASLMAIVLTSPVIVNAYQSLPDSISIDDLVVDGSEDKPTLLARLRQVFIVRDFTPTHDLDFTSGYSMYLIWQRRSDDPIDSDSFPQRNPIAQASFTGNRLTSLSRHWYVDSTVTFENLFFQLLERVSQGRSCRITFAKDYRPVATITCGRMRLSVQGNEILESLLP